MSLSSYLFERHQAAAHHMSQKLATWRAAYRRMQTRQALRPVLCDPLEPRMLMSALPYTFTDASGDTVTVTLTGPGDMVITQSGTADAQGIALSNTTERSTLKITVTNADKAVVPTTSIGVIDLGTGRLGTLSAGSVDLTGSGIICSAGSTSSYIRSITVRDLKNGADIDLDNNTATTITTAINARVVGDGSNILLSNAITTAIFANVGDNSITATKISTLKVTGIKGDATYVGNFGGDLTLSATKGTVLGSATIAGGVTGVQWTVGGSVGSLTVTGVLNTSTMNIGGSMGPVKAADLTGDTWNLAAGSISRITTAGNLTGTYTGIGLGTVIVGGNMNATLNLGAATTKDNASVLGSLSVTGTIAGTIKADHGSVGTISGASTSALTLTITNGLINKISFSGAMAGGNITARRIGAWSVGGNLTNTTATISGTGLSGYAVLNSLVVTGDITTTYIKATLGGVGTIKANAVTGSTFEFPDGRIGALTLASNVSDGYVQGLTTLDTITAQSIGTWSVGGNVTNVIATLGSYSKMHGKQALDTLKVTGNITGTKITATYGGAGAISANSIGTSDLKFADGRITKIKSTTSHTSGVVNAMSVGTWTVGTSLNGITATLATDSSMHRYYALTDLIVGSDITNTTVNATYGSARTVSGASMSGSSFNFADGRITTLTSAGTQDGGTVKAQSIGTWKVGANLANVTATLAIDSSMHNHYAVTDLLVTGTVSTVDIEATYGGVRTIKAASIGATNNKIYFADGYISAITTTQGITNLSLKAESIGTWTAGANLDGVTATLGNSTTKGYLALEKLDVTGDLIGTSITASEGGAGNIWVNNISNSTVSFVNGRISWLDVAGNMTTTDLSIHNQVKAFSIGKWYVSGSLANTEGTFGADDNKDRLALGKLAVGGAMTNVDLTAAYDGGDSISAASITGGSLDFGSSISSITTTQGMTDTNIIARRIINWTIGGDMTNLSVALGDSTTTRNGKWLTNVIENLSVSGTIDKCTIVTDGSLGRVKAEQMIDSNLYIGYVYSGGDYVLHSNEDIDSLTITGDGSKTAATTNNIIKSYTLSNLSVNYPSNSAITTHWIGKLTTTQYPGGTATTKVFSNVMSTPSSTPADTAAIAGLAFTWI